MHQIGKENQQSLKQNGTYQLLVRTDDVDILGDNIKAVKKVREALLRGGRERNVLKVKCMSHQQMQGKTGNAIFQ
jgi:hypothetical protein